MRIFFTFLAAMLLLQAPSAVSQEKFFTLSGGNRGDAASSKLEVLHQKLRERQDKNEDCAALGMLRAPGHPKADGNDCISSLVLEEDGDITVEKDLKVGSGVRIGEKFVQDHALESLNKCNADEKLFWNGSDWACEKETDPKVGQLSAGKWCAERGGRVVCDREPPSTESNFAENIHKFALKSSSFPSGGCPDGSVLTTNGTSLSCVKDAGGNAEDMLLGELFDVNLSGVQHGDVLTYNSGANIWQSASEGDPTVESFAKSVPVGISTGNRCGVGYVLTFIDGQLECVPDAGGAVDSLFLADLADVTNTEPTALQILGFDGEEWIPTTEFDASVKDWAKVDVANTTSITSVQRCQSNEILTYDGTQLACTTDVGGPGTIALNDMIDVSHTTPPNTDDVLAWDGSMWVSQAEKDATVEDFAKNTLPTCGPDQILTGDGTSLSCVDDIGGAGDGITLSDLTDVSVSTPSTNDILVYTGSGWQNATGVEDFARTAITNLTGGRCPVGYILTFDGTQLSCVAASAIGLWTDNTTYISRSGMSLVNAGQTLPAGLTGAGTRALWYPNKAAFRAGQVTSAQWDDANIGNNSFATGYDVTASGENAIALGDEVVVRAEGSVGIGTDIGVVAGAERAIALGTGVMLVPSAIESVAVGLGGGGPYLTTQPNTMTVQGGKFVVGAGASSGALLADFEGSVGATEYCDEDGANCTTAADIALTVAGGANLWTDETTHISRTGIVAIAGELGVGTSSPSTELEVVGDVSASGLLSIAGGANISATTNLEILDVAQTLNADGDARIGGNLTVVGALNVSGTQTIDGVVFANGGIEAASTITATAFVGDGSGITGVTADSADWYGLTNIPTGVENISNTELTTAELTQLQNIDGTTISATQFGYLGALDQSLATTDSVNFANITGASGLLNSLAVTTTVLASGNISTSADMNAAQYCDQNGANCTTAADIATTVAGGANLWTDETTHISRTGIVAIDGELGVGTSSPSSTLHIAGVAQVGGTGAEACDNDRLGAIRFNPATGKMQICRQ